MSEDAATDLVRRRAEARRHRLLAAKEHRLQKIMPGTETAANEGLSSRGGRHLSEPLDDASFGGVSLSQLTATTAGMSSQCTAAEACQTTAEPFEKRDVRTTPAPLEEVKAPFAWSKGSDSRIGGAAFVTTCSAGLGMATALWYLIMSSNVYFLVVFSVTRAMVYGIQGGSQPMSARRRHAGEGDQTKVDFLESGMGKTLLKVSNIISSCEKGLNLVRDLCAGVFTFGLTLAIHDCWVHRVLFA
eukprot:GHVU01153697.1.p1 GENE.GHVU01153697.1~~GHVU01153697.1.p1  ORF type:complete len:244 (-),score=18.94 GHVU01153697.1:661-1392(-)